MGRAPCCDKANVKRGPWSPEEDATLKSYLQTHGTGGNWIALPRKAGLRRCGKSCRLRWLNYLRPDIKHGGFTDDEDRTICLLYNQMGSRWSVIASHLAGRTDNDVKNYWNTKLKKKLLAGKITLTLPNYTNPAQIPTDTNYSSNTTTTIINHPNTPNNSFAPKLETDCDFSSSVPNSRTTHINHEPSESTTSTVHDQRPSYFSYDQNSLFSFITPRVLMMDFSAHDHADQFDNNNNNYVTNPKIDGQLAGSGSNTINPPLPWADFSSEVAVINDVNGAGEGCDGYGGSGASLVDFGFGLLPYDIMNGVSFDQEKSAVSHGIWS